MTGRLANAGNTVGTQSATDLVNQGITAAQNIVAPQPQKATISPLLAGVIAGAVGYAFTKKPMTAALIGGAGLLGADYYNDEKINLK